MSGASYHRPEGLLAGFAAARPEPDVPEIRSLGEQWAPVVFSIHRHAHQVWECYLQLAGHAVWASGGRRHELGPGGWYLVRPGVVHELVRPPASHHYLFVEMDLDACLRRLPDCAPVFAAAAPFSIGCSAELEDPFRQLVHEVAFDAAWRGTGLRLAADRLVLQLARLLAAPERTRLVDRHPAVDQACRLIDASPGAGWTVQALARRVGLSAGHLRELFRRECNCAPHAYLLERRIALAKRLLRDGDLSITRIAQLCGFAGSQHFARHFKRATGMTGSAWRAADDQAGTK